MSDLDLTTPHFSGELVYERTCSMVIIGVGQAIDPGGATSRTVEKEAADDHRDQPFHSPLAPGRRSG
ncbi:hypothetical protein ABIA38_002144 [Embleya sp. AB8]